MIKKTYLDYTISERENSSWWNVYHLGKFKVSVANEEEARRYIWLNTGKGEPITDEMMQLVESGDN